MPDHKVVVSNVSEETYLLGGQEQAGKENKLLCPFHRPPAEGMVQIKGGSYHHKRSDITCVFPLQMIS